MNERPTHFSELQAAVLYKCLTDKEFKKKLEENPAETLMNTFKGLELGNAKVCLHELDGKEFHLSIPPKSTTQLSDADLQKIAGGKANCVIAAAVACVCE